jgi:hypothetical protein
MGKVDQFLENGIRGWMRGEGIMAQLELINGNFHVPSTFRRAII